MRAEHKVGLIVGVFVVAGGAIWWFSRPGNELTELPLDDRQAIEGRSSEGVRLSADAEPAPSESRSTADRSARPSADRGTPPPAPARRPTAVPTPTRLVESAPPGATEETTPLVTRAETGQPVGPREASAVGEEPAGTAAGRPGTPVEGAEPDGRLETPRISGQPVAPPRRRELAPKPPSRTTYVIQPGDRLIDIAREEYGDWRLWEAIKAANPDVDENCLQIGQQIGIPSREEALRLVQPAPPAAPAVPRLRPGAEVGRATYVVERGDTLIKIARNVLKDASRWEEIYELNRDQLESPHLLRIGIELRLPPLEKARPDSAVP